MEEQASRELIEYEYRFESTPKYTVIEEDTWQLYDIKYMYLPNGAFNFIAIFRRPTKSKPYQQ